MGLCNDTFNCSQNQHIFEIRVAIDYFGDVADMWTEIRASVNNDLRDGGAK